MAEINDADIVITRRTSAGRFVIFTSTDVQPDWTLRWWSAVADTGGDVFGILVRLNVSAAPAGWTARQLLTVIHARMEAEFMRRPTEATQAVLAPLNRAVAACRHLMVPDDPVTFEPDAFTTARHGEFHLPLCPDPEGLEEGITPEQLLIILDQLLFDATRARPHVPDHWVCRRHVAAALAAEVRRVISASG